jgi:Zn-dependent protease with chaperone function
MSSYTPPVESVVVKRWPSERPLFAISLLVSIVLWILAVVSIIGIIYAAFLGLIFFLLHIGFIAHIRGSAVRLSQEQFPELHQRVARLAVRLGMTRVPETFVMQGGGALNAFATRFLGANIVVLYSDLLEACGENEAARDMIIAHELGHIHAGHLVWHWVLLPSSLVPFLGTALSRAREYTCDRFGLAGAGSSGDALLGLSILAAGAKYGPRVNREALVAQRAALNSGWMTLGEWLSTHPPLSKRLAALEPGLMGSHPRAYHAGPIQAAAMLFFAVALPLGAGAALIAANIPKMLEEFAAAAEDAGSEPVSPYVAPPVDSAMAVVKSDLASLSALLEQRRSTGLPLPWDTVELYEHWMAVNPDAPAPRDPFDGGQYGYRSRDGQYQLWSSGPDGESRTHDDIVVDSRLRRDSGG